MSRPMTKIYLALSIALLMTLCFALSPSQSAHAKSGKGKVIVVDLSDQWFYAYAQGKKVYNAAITSGRPALPTPIGTYQVFNKVTNIEFRSPWPEGSPHWYPPTPVNYGLEFIGGGFFLHDATWRSVFGPGTNGWNYDPQFGWQWGSHGCVSMSLNDAAWLYNWANIGTTVRVQA